MNGEPTNIFKNIRVLWFPMSLNAVVLAAMAVLVFWAGTGIACLMAGAGSISQTTWVASHFAGVSLASLSSFRWPPSDLGWIFGWQLILFFALLATFGVAICRVLVLRIARDEYCTLREAWSFAWKVKLTGLIFPLAVLIPIAFLFLCNLLAGLIGSIPYVGPILTLPLLPLVITSSVVMVTIAVSSLLATGLIPAAIATERKGTYDSLGKCINYVFARPIPLILYLTVLTLFLGLLHTLFLKIGVVENAIRSSIVIDGAYRRIAVGNPTGLGGFEWFMAEVFWVVLSLWRLFIWGLIVSFALGGFTSAFLIFRHDVDGIGYEAVAGSGPSGPAETPENPPLAETAISPIAEPEGADAPSTGEDEPQKS